MALTSALLAALARARLPESAPTGRRVDLIGSLLLILGLGCLLSAVTEARLGSPVLVAALIVAGSLLLMAFEVLEPRISNPILKRASFREPGFSGATLAAFASGGRGACADADGTDAAGAQHRHLASAGCRDPLGLVVDDDVHGAQGALVAGSDHLASAGDLCDGRMRRRANLLILASPGAVWASVLPGLLVAGVSNGILNASLGHEAVQTVAPGRSTMGSAANNTVRYLISGTRGAGLHAAWQRSVRASSMIGLMGVIAMLVLSGWPRRKTSVL